MTDKDRKNLELIISHCNLMASHIEYFDDDKEEYIDNEHYQAAFGFEILGYI